MMSPRVRVTWISWALFELSPFKELRIFSPFVWGVIICGVSVTPLIYSQQYDLVFSRPLLSGVFGCTYVLFWAYLFNHLYNKIFSSLKVAVAPKETEKLNIITHRAVTYINNDRLWGRFYLITLAITALWFTSSFYELLDRKIFPYFYIFDDFWYVDDDGKIYRLVACGLLISASLAILCAALWFQFWHWRMFQELLSLELAKSPILIYHGFSRLWVITNISSIALLSGNFFIMYLVNFKPHPIQVLIALLVTLPGTLGLLHPTSRLYWILWDKKDARVSEILKAANKEYRKVIGPEKLLVYSSVYSDVLAEKSAGNIQAIISFLIGLLSFVIAIIQIFGLDYYTKIFGAA